MENKYQKSGCLIEKERAESCNGNRLLFSKTPALSSPRIPSPADKTSAIRTDEGSIFPTLIPPTKTATRIAVR